MNLRNLVIGVFGLTCAGTLCAAVLKHRQLTILRVQRQSLLIQAEPATQQGSASSSPEPAIPSATNVPVSAELLRLRGQVGQLTQRLRELENVANDNQQLRLQLATARTNTPPERKLPPGYIRKAQARFMGYGTPENTVQTFLWALANRDYQGLLDTFSAEAARQFAQSIPAEQSTNFLEQAKALPGLGIVGRKDLPDGSVELTVELVPGMDKPMRLQRFNGAWKLVSPNL